MSTEELNSPGVVDSNIWWTIGFNPRPRTSGRPVFYAVFFFHIIVSIHAPVQAGDYVRLWTTLG